MEGSGSATLIATIIAEAGNGLNNFGQCNIYMYMVRLKE